MAHELQIFAAAAGSGYVDSASMQALGLGAQIGILLPYSRTHESEADIIGLDLMSEAGFDPRESVPLWQNMAEQAGGQGPAGSANTGMSASVSWPSVAEVLRDRGREILRQIKAPKRRNAGSIPSFGNAELAEKIRPRRGLTFATDCSVSSGQDLGPEIAPNGVPSFDEAQLPAPLPARRCFQAGFRLVELTARIEAFHPKSHSEPYSAGVICLVTARLFSSKFFPGDNCFLLPNYFRFLLLNHA